MENLKQIEELEEHKTREEKIADRLLYEQNQEISNIQ